MNHENKYVYVVAVLNCFDGENVEEQTKCIAYTEESAKAFYDKLQLSQKVESKFVVKVECETELVESFCNCNFLYFQAREQNKRPSDEELAKLELEVDQEETRGEKVKDPDEPSLRGKTAFQFFVAEKKEKVKEDNPKKSAKEVYEILKKIWEDVEGTPAIKKYRQMEKDEKEHLKKIYNEWLAKKENESNEDSDDEKYGMDIDQENYAMQDGRIKEEMTDLAIKKRMRDEVVERQKVIYVCLERLRSLELEKLESKGLLSHCYDQIEPVCSARLHHQKIE